MPTKILVFPHRDIDLVKVAPKDFSSNRQAQAMCLCSFFKNPQCSLKSEISQNVLFQLNTFLLQYNSSLEWVNLIFTCL